MWAKARPPTDHRTDGCYPVACPLIHFAPSLSLASRGGGGVGMQKNSLVARLINASRDGNLGDGDGEGGREGGNGRHLLWQQ